MKNIESSRYPIGKYEYGETYSLDETRKNIKTIARLPKDLKKVLKNLGKNVLREPYPNGCWTVRQVIPQLGDSHTNAYIRLKTSVQDSSVQNLTKNYWRYCEQKSVFINSCTIVQQQVSCSKISLFGSEYNVSNLPLALDIMKTKQPSMSLTVDIEILGIKCTLSAHGGAEDMRMVVNETLPKLITEVVQKTDNNKRINKRQDKYPKTNQNALWWGEERREIGDLVYNGEINRALEIFRRNIAAVPIQGKNNLVDRLDFLGARFSANENERRAVRINYEEFTRTNNQILEELRGFLIEVDDYFSYDKY